MKTIQQIQISSYDDKIFVILATSHGKKTHGKVVASFPIGFNDCADFVANAVSTVYSIPIIWED